MSSGATPVTAAHQEYLAARTRPEDAFLTALKAEAAADGIPSIWISPEQASLMQILLRSAGARTVVEVGTLAGYSAISMARALPAGGRTETIELNPAYADFAERKIAESDVAGRVHVLRGAGAEVLPRLQAGAYDAAFIDADKANYGVYLEHCLRLVRPGGLLMVDNAFAFGQLLDAEPSDPGVAHVRAFNDRMAAVPGLQGIIVPIGDGLWVAVREG
ncbi:MAG TPA: O-methyltransferase [Planctomycetota bacterium]